MKKTILTTIALVAAVFAVQGFAGSVTSLRGDMDLTKTNEAPKTGKLLTREGGFERSFEQQPPLIPHKMDKSEINLKVNGCMKCHSKENFEKEKAPEVSESHYKDASGKVLDKISMRRYFCTQCHVPQLDSDVLVENTFQPAK
ncbi:MAG: nitrate reductase cytochrome c-type subunit [Gammaproteobacteria bacterium]